MQNKLQQKYGIELFCNGVVLKLRVCTQNGAKRVGVVDPFVLNPDLERDPDPRFNGQKLKRFTVQQGF